VAAMFSVGMTRNCQRPKARWRSTSLRSGFRRGFSNEWIVAGENVQSVLVARISSWSSTPLAFKARERR
jgi:hypothetical protein